MSSPKKSKPLTKRGLTRRRNAARRQAQRLKTPLGRLEADGATSDGQIRRRLQWLTQEWQLPPCPKVGIYPRKELLDYVQKHGITLDWLFRGRLEDLQDMMRKRRMQAGAPSVERIMEKYATLSPEHQRRVSDEVQRILEERSLVENSERER